MFTLRLTDETDCPGSLKPSNDAVVFGGFESELEISVADAS